MSLLRRHRKPTYVGDTAYVGSVWMNGDPVLAADLEDAAAWHGSERYDELVEELGRRDHAPDVSIPLGKGVAFVLSLEFDDGTADVFVTADRRLLVLGIVYADGDDWESFVPAALHVSREEVGAIDLRSRRLALFPAAAEWDELGQVEAEPRSALKRREVRSDALLVPLAGGAYGIAYGYLEEDRYGIQAWLFSRR